MNRTVNSLIALSIMIAITTLNAGLALDLIAAGGNALALALNGQNIFVLGGIEMVLVLISYVAGKGQQIPVPS